MEEQIVKILEKINGFVDKIPGLYIDIRNQFLTYEFTGNVRTIINVVIIGLVIAMVTLMARALMCIDKIAESDYDFEEGLLEDAKPRNERYEEVIASKRALYYEGQQDTEVMTQYAKNKKWLRLVKIAIITLIVLQCALLYVQYKAAADVTFFMEYVRGYTAK